MLNFRTIYGKELEDLQEKRKCLQFYLETISLEDEEKLTIGTIVELKYGKKGRIVHFYSNGIIGVGELDDDLKLVYSWELKIKRDNIIKNCSSDIYGRIERSIWQLCWKISKLERRLNDSKIPDILLINRINHIHVIEIGTRRTGLPTPQEKGTKNYITYGDLPPARVLAGFLSFGRRNLEVVDFVIGLVTNSSGNLWVSSPRSSIASAVLILTIRQPL